VDGAVCASDLARAAIGWFTAAWTPRIEDTDDLFMRRRLLIFLLAALAAISMAMPLWAALRSERSLIGNPTVYLNRAHDAARPFAEAATLVFTGLVLIGLASAVRRTS
jgi:hypothetical protein